MRIGIDIDNTLTEVQDKLNKAAFDYAISLGKKIDNYDNSLENITNNGDTYKKKFQFTYEELKYFLKDIQESITNNAVPREKAKEVIDKLKEDGHEIYIVTARDSEFHDDPYKLSKDWLDKNDIYYDKIIVNAREKSSVCKKENIDLFIDDQLNNCLSVANVGIKTIMITDKIYEYDELTQLSNWTEIYEFINLHEIIKIIEYNEKYKDEICSFINESMHYFINRPYKERYDVFNIESYYIKNKGNFWIAIDVKKDKVVGSIAVENRGEYGILKRFYVDKDYQKIGIGNYLYKIFYKYVKEKTKIEEINLSCGRILKNAHNFYIKKGFQQVNSLPVEMHYADDDDFFVKKVDRGEEKCF